MVILQPPSEQQSSSLVTSILFANCLQVTKFQTFPSMKFSICPQYSNSAMNPLLYAGLSDNFRKSFRKVIIVIEALKPEKLNCNCRRATVASSGRTQTHSRETTPSPLEGQFGVPGSQQCFRRTRLQGWGADRTRPPMSPPHPRGPITALRLEKLEPLPLKIK